MQVISSQGGGSSSAGVAVEDAAAAASSLRAVAVAPHGPSLPPLVLVPADAEAAAQGGRYSLAGSPVLGPYPPLEPLQQRRLAARRHDVTYVYDFPSVFEDALMDAWSARAAAGAFIVVRSLSCRAEGAGDGVGKWV
eukprot:365487-Chlamydomonas_euryale.AAC.1